MPVNTPRSHHIDRRAGAVAAQGSGEPDDLLTETELGDWLGVSAIWLQTGRHAGYGPHFLRIGRRVRYRRSDVLGWLDERRYRKTAEYAPPVEREPGDNRPLLLPLRLRGKQLSGAVR